jgi:hypothetical protein
MSTLRAVLEECLAELGQAEVPHGGGPIRRIGPAQRDKLLRDLRSAVRGNTRVFMICLLMTAVLLVIQIAMIAQQYRQFDSLAAISGAFGISSAGLIYFAFRAWRQKTALEVMIVLAANFDDDALKSLVRIMTSWARGEAIAAPPLGGENAGVP